MSDLPGVKLYRQWVSATAAHRRTQIKTRISDQARDQRQIATSSPRSTILRDLRDCGHLAGGFLAEGILQHLK
ncbi:hypothetical protein BJA5080_07962 [Bradyrhizobium diazoefficiens SEMIA 5080]|uniref:Uncharacterized protein n=1 Tax=Bradyrhizobium diazoefficiens SEMIA 5080 TaxID=754504 RepID=A0A837CPR6_9BRAD|nr:hypothetical protein BJA5080_07962 [Bradyrhizobium diazoefficiens SEMIA 5080]